jgi:hemerythrin
MALYNWGPSFELNVDFVDSQHKQLVEIVNKLHEAMKSGHGRDIMGSVLDELMSYTKRHFADEERWYVQNKLPTIGDHRKLHANFVAQIIDIRRKFEGGSATVTPEILKVLGDWLINHIKGTDKQAVLECKRLAA